MSHRYARYRFQVISPPVVAIWLLLLLNNCLVAKSIHHLEIVSRFNFKTIGLVILTML